MQADLETDDALIDASRLGDHGAFAQIVEKYGRAVYAVSFATTRDRTLADDLTQDTFVAAWRQLDELRDRTRLPAWLCGIARNLGRDARKRQRREHGTVSAELVADVTPFDALSDAESERVLVSALATVPDVYREALVLFYFQHHSVEQVAQLLGISPRTTNKRLSRGRKHLSARVQSIVERKLTSRGPKRDLATCVLAAIGVLGSASHVDASPAAATAKGSTMHKLALATVLVTTVGGAGLLAADAITPARQTPPASAAAAGATVKPPARKTTPKPSRPAAAPAPARADRGARAVPPPPPSLPTVPSTAPDCASVARHMAELTLGEFLSANKFSEAKRAQFIELRARDVAARCEAEAWTADRRLCISGATDVDGANLACKEGMIGTPDEIASLPSELHCDAVTGHLAALMRGPDGRLAATVAKLARAGQSVKLEQLTDKLREQKRAECDRLPWSASLRRCIVTSRTEQEQTRCW